MTGKFQINKLALTAGQALDPNSAASSGKFNPKEIQVYSIQVYFANQIFFK